MFAHLLMIAALVTCILVAATAVTLGMARAHIFAQQPDGVIVDLRHTGAFPERNPAATV